MACSNASIARVYFKYSGEDWQNVISFHPPVNTECVGESNYAPFTGGQCDCAVYRITITYKTSPTASNTTIAFDVWGAIGSIQSYKDIQNNYTHRYGFLVACKGKFANQVPFHVCQSPQNYFHVVYSVGNPNPVPPLITIVSVTVARSNGAADTCGNPPPPDTNYLFKVIDASGAIYQRAAKTCPQAYIECDESCPPGTCECQQKNGLVCCYNDLGLVVKSFYRN